MYTCIYIIKINIIHNQITFVFQLCSAEGEARQGKLGTAFHWDSCYVHYGYV